MESNAINKVFGNTVWCSSTKPLTGHALGASGAIEIAFCWLILSSLNKERKLPLHHWNGVPDDTLKHIKLVNRQTKTETLSYCLSNSFAFGGSNTCVVIGK
jgi:3-oxoacyl-[acyl-carrier-protein] synthase-1